jgi:hypothetical protein
VAAGSFDELVVGIEVTYGTGNDKSAAGSWIVAVNWANARKLTLIPPSTDGVEHVCGHLS